MTTAESRMVELEKDLAYYKELYELEKETNELNQIKLVESNTLNAQDQQRHERELTDLRAKFRRLENTMNTQRADETAAVAFRQRIRQLELEVSSLTERVRIAENQATKLEEDNRAKEFRIREQQKDYDTCLSKCNALELMIMSSSQTDGHLSMHQSSIESPTTNGSSFAASKQSPNTDTASETVPESPQQKLANGDAKISEEPSGGDTKNGHVEVSHTKLSSHTNNINGNGGAAAVASYHVPIFQDLNAARAFCREHSDSVESLLRFAELIRAVRKETRALSTSVSFDGSYNRIPLTIKKSKETLQDLQRQIGELVLRPNA